MRVTASRMIEATTADVFALVAEIEGYAAWLPGTVEAERVAEESGEVGAVYRVVEKQGWRRVTQRLEVVETEAPRRLVVESRPFDFAQDRPWRGGESAQWIWDFWPAGEGSTRVTLVGEAQLPRALRLAGPVVRRLAGWMLGRYLRRLEKAVKETSR